MHGVEFVNNAPIIVYLTVCTHSRRPWLATRRVHAALQDVWDAAEAWQVGRYVLMPDHLHLFASPVREEVSFDNWVRYWKSLYSKRHARDGEAWQANHWDRRLRSLDSYDEKWEYVLNNPVRAGLVARAEDWPYAGERNKLEW